MNLDESVRELDLMMGDPMHAWVSFNVSDAETGTFYLYQCPQCGAACFNPYTHKAWHLQIEREVYRDKDAS